MDRLQKAAVMILAAVFVAVALAAVSGSIPFGNPSQVLAADGDDTADKAPADGEAPAPGEGEAPPCPECPECPDPAKVVLRGLEEKKKIIEAESERIAQEKKDLETYEGQIDEKLESLTALKKQIDEDMARLEEKKSQQEQAKEAAFEAKMARLVKMYAGMKPKDAAKIVDQMEIGVAQEIFMRMREANAASILGFVDSVKAAKISERLAFKKR